MFQCPLLRSASRLVISDTRPCLSTRACARCDDRRRHPFIAQISCPSAARAALSAPCSALSGQPAHRVAHAGDRAASTALAPAMASWPPAQYARPDPYLPSRPRPPVGAPTQPRHHIAQPRPPFAPPAPLAGPSQPRKRQRSPEPATVPPPLSNRKRRRLEHVPVPPIDPALAAERTHRYLRAVRKQCRSLASEGGAALAIDFEGYQQHSLDTVVQVRRACVVALSLRSACRCCAGSGGTARSRRARTIGTGVRRTSRSR